MIDQIECYTKETNQLTGFVYKGLLGRAKVLCSRAVLDRTRSWRAQAQPGREARWTGEKILTSAPVLSTGIHCRVSSVKVLRTS